MKKVIVYPGRFQPMLSHHAIVFNRLVAEHPDSEVYIVTSDKTEPGKSPFNFKEKQLIAQAQGIDPSKVLFAKSPYNPEFIKDHFSDPENIAIFYAVGEKDMLDDPRFTFDNIDPQSGLNIKPNGTPYYYQMINTYKDNPQPMLKRGYIIQAPTVIVKDEVASASAFRKALVDAPTKETAKEIFNKQFLEYNDSVFELVYNKIAGDKKMSEDLNILKQLAGLSVNEDTPVEFDTPLKPEKIKFAPVSKSSAVMSIANRFPAGVNVNDPDVKQEEFLKALMTSPSSILSEINERIMPDENGLEVSKKLSELIDSMREQGLMDLDKDDRAFVLKIVKVAIKKMKLEAGDYRDFDPESGALENVDLSDIRSEYGVEEALKKNSKGYLVYSNGNPLSFSDWKYENQKEGGEGSEQAYKKYLELVKEEDISEGGECYHCDGTDPDCKECGGTGYVQFDDDPQEPSQEEIDKHYSKKEESAPFGEPSQHEMMVNQLQSAYDKGGEEALAKEMGLSIEELDREIQEFGMEHGLHADDDRDEIIQSVIDKHYGKKEESAPFGEPSREELEHQRLTTAYEKGGKEELARASGFTEEELSAEIDELAQQNDKHADDDRDELIGMWIDDTIASADWKDHGEYESVEDESMSKMRKLAGLPEEDKKHSIWVDGDQGTTKDGHNYRAVGDDQDASQYLKVFYGDGKYFRIYYDSNVGRYSPDQVAPETNDPKAEKIFADLPDDFFKKYGAEGENGIEDIIDMIKSVDESIEEAMCGCCGNDPCDCPKDCDGCRKDEAVEDTTVKALDDAMAELRTLAGI